MNYKITLVATCGCEIRNENEEVVAWSIDPIWAEKIKKALEEMERKGE